MFGPSPDTRAELLDVAEALENQWRSSARASRSPSAPRAASGGGSSAFLGTASRGWACWSIRARSTGSRCVGGHGIAWAGALTDGWQEPVAACERGRDEGGGGWAREQASQPRRVRGDGVGGFGRAEGGQARWLEMELLKCRILFPFSYVRTQLRSDTARPAPALPRSCLIAHSLVRLRPRSVARKAPAPGVSCAGSVPHPSDSYTIPPPLPATIWLDILGMARGPSKG